MFRKGISMKKTTHWMVMGLLCLFTAAMVFGVQGGKTLITPISLGEAPAILDQCAQGRMKKKMLGAIEALTAGVGRVVIADGRVAQPLHRALAGQGTVIE